MTSKLNDSVVHAKKQKIWESHRDALADIFDCDIVISSELSKFQKWILIIFIP